MRAGRTFAAAIAAAALAAAPAAAQPAPQPYGTGDGGGFHDVLPPGTSGFDDLAQLAQFEAGGQRPPHNDDQLGMYSGLLSGYPTLSAPTLARYFKDSTFGVRDGDVASVEHPRDDVTIVRDRGFGVPHVYGSTREGTEFGIGYATAEDRLFFVDVLRHVGRAQLTAFVGGAPANRVLDAQVWAVAPYTESDLERQVEYRPRGYETQSDELRAESAAYVAGINRYIAEARLDPSKMPAEYAAIGQPLGPQDFKQTDIVAIATLVGAIFGAGGGQELESALSLEAARARFGAARGIAVWRDFREANDPEAPTTVRGQRFPYEVAPRHPTGVALPDPGSVKDLVTLNPSTTTGQTPTAGQGSQQPGLPTLPPLPARGLAYTDAHSNALVVAASRSATGHPLAVFGPQVGYFSPQILMEQDIHGPGIDARGAAFPGTNLFVQLGHGRDYAWSATSAGQDITDTFAVPLCDPAGGRATIDSQGYVFHGRCLPIDTRTRTNSWTPNAADQTPPGSESLTTHVTQLGIVVGRARVHGRPVAYTSLRTTFMHEPDSALGFAELNDPSFTRGPRDFQRAAGLIGYTFNWFYVDARHSAYFNSGLDPVRAPRTDPDLPVSSAHEWRRYDPTANVPEYLPQSAHPRAVDQAWMTSWNNKQAPGVRAADGEWGFGPLYRSQLLDEGVRAALRRSRRASLVDLVKAMESAATVDLRGRYVLPWALRVLRARPRGRAPALDRSVRTAIAKLTAWQRRGAHRIDRHGHGYDDSAAIETMDAWWPRWIAAEFEPVLGRRLFGQLKQMIQLDNTPNNAGQHLGSAYQDGWYGYADKDLRTLLGARVRGRYSRVYCGGGSLARCQRALLGSLRSALSVSRTSLYADDACAAAGRQGDQECFDAIVFRPLGAITQPLIAWQNRPTYQQAVSVERAVSR